MFNHERLLYSFKSFPRVIFLTRWRRTYVNFINIGLKFCIPLSCQLLDNDIRVTAIVIFLVALYMDRVKRIWYLSPMRVAKVQASLRIRAVSPEPSLLAHISSESRGTFRQKARSLAPLNGWACAVKICHDRMLEDTNSLDGAHMLVLIMYSPFWWPFFEHFPG